MSKSKIGLAIFLSLGMMVMTLVLPHGQDVAVAEQIGHTSHAAPAPNTNNLDVDAMQLSKQAKNLSPQVINLAMIAYKNALKQGVTHKKLLTIVDYSKPSTERRLWVFDLAKGKLLFNELVAHGKKSGENSSVSFSNAPQSNKSSIGVYLTQETYSGKHGYSLKLDGLDKGFNDNAAARAIVVHSADYVSNNVASSKGRLGRSLGCLALSPKTSKPVIDTIKNGTVIFAYYPDAKWIEGSRFLGI